jgi:hypothetical protein
MIVLDKNNPFLVTYAIESWPPKGWHDVESQDRSVIDFLVARQRFKTAGKFGWDFTVERDRIIGPSVDSTKALLKIADREAQQDLKQMKEFKDAVPRDRDQPLQPDIPFWYRIFREPLD